MALDQVTREEADRKMVQFREIVDTHSMGFVDDQEVDAFSASAVVQMYDALKPDNQLRFASISPYSMVMMAFDCINRAGK